MRHDLPAKVHNFFGIASHATMSSFMSHDVPQLTCYTMYAKHNHSTKLIHRYGKQENYSNSSNAKNVLSIQVDLLH